MFTGAYAINPLNNEEIPIWIADYVLMGYGTGAIMAVPGHDARDYEFAKTFDLSIVEVVSGGNIKKEAHVNQGADATLVNSGFLNGLSVPEAKEKAIAVLEEKKIGARSVNYKMRDWIFARQRYWGEPFPLIHKENGDMELIDDKDLPVTLPEVDRYEPTGTGESPLSAIESWVNVKAQDGSNAKRETDTMPQWAGSCWYYLRFMDPKNESRFCSRRKRKILGTGRSLCRWGQSTLFCIYFMPGFGIKFCLIWVWFLITNLLKGLSFKE